jgi:hypothetical protein
MNGSEFTKLKRRAFLQRSTAAAALALPAWCSLSVFAADESVPKVAKRVDVTTTGDTQKLAAAIKLARDTQETLKKIKDYEAAFTKRELVGKKLLESEMQVKFRQQPFSVYIKYKRPHAGREVIYVDGLHKGKLLAHEEGITSIVGTIKLLPTSKDAMEENRYPLTMFGMNNMVAKVVEQWQADEKHDDVVVKFFPNAKMNGVECKVAETSFPKQVAHAKFHVTRLYVAKDSGLPVRVEQFGFPTKADKLPIIEEYTYSDIKANAGLSDLDFDPANKTYGF